MSETRARQRMSREARYTQLVAMAWKIIREEGTEALTLGHLAEQAGVTKPVVYDHFTNRSGLFAALLREYDRRQNRKLDEAISQTEPVAEKLARVIADAWIECVLLQGREMPSVMAALAGTPELEKLRRDYAIEFIAKCHAWFAPFCRRPLQDAALWAMIGAAEGLAWAVVQGAISELQAKEQLQQTIISMLEATEPH